MWAWTWACFLATQHPPSLLWSLRSCSTIFMSCSMHRKNKTPVGILLDLRSELKPSFSVFKEVGSTRDWIVVAAFEVLQSSYGLLEHEGAGAQQVTTTFADYISLRFHRFPQSTQRMFNMSHRVEYRRVDKIIWRSLGEAALEDILSLKGTSSSWSGI